VQWYNILQEQGWIEMPKKETTKKEVKEDK